MSVFLVGIHCPNQHPQGAVLKEYAAELPPEAWMETVSRDMQLACRDHPAFARCSICGIRQSRQWYVSVSLTKAKTMAEAQAALEQCAKPV